MSESEAPGWYVMQEEQQLGPYTGEQLVDFARNGNILPETLVWAEGMESWLPASQIEGLFAAPAAPVAQPARMPQFRTSPYGGFQTNPYAPGALHAGGTPAADGSYPHVGVTAASFGLWMGLWVTCLLLGLMAPIVFGGTAEDGSNAGTIVVVFFVLIGLSIASGLWATILTLIYLARAWKCLQPGGMARTTPGAAAGLLLVPLFNLYWIFQAYSGLATDWNRTVASHDDLRASPRMNEGLFLTFCICSLVLPVVNLVAGPMVMSQICTGINYFAFRPTRHSGGPLGFTLR